MKGKVFSIFATALATMLIFSVNVFAETPSGEIIDESTNSNGGGICVDNLLPENQNGRTGRANYSGMWVGSSTKGGNWYYGVSGSALPGSIRVPVWSQLRTSGYQNHTSVKPGKDAAIVASGWKSKGTQAHAAAPSNVWGGNRAFYDYR